METNFTPELIAKARQAKSAEELMAMAKENGIEMTEEAAKANFEKLNKLNRSGEISDEELGNVSGGRCGDPPKCCECGQPLSSADPYPGPPGYDYYCYYCGQYRKV